LRGLRGSQNLPLGPASAKGFDELHGGKQALTGELRIGPVRLKGGAVGVHHLEVTHDPRGVTVAREFGGPAAGRAVDVEAEAKHEVANLVGIALLLCLMLFAFRNDAYLWWRVAEYSYDDFLIRNRTRT